jgi:glycosyltransferase involved in cell wall biosynthesis
MKYDVTIGIPFYNVEPYIARSLESALAQTYPSIEFLLVDDASSDLSVDIVRRFQMNHPRGAAIRMLSNPKNLGVSSSRNRIIDEAQGDYLYFMDADDLIAEDTISLLMQQIHQYQAEIAFGSYEKTETSGLKTTYQYPDLQLLEGDGLANFAYRKFNGIQASACNYLVKLTVLREHHLHFIDVNYWEDLVFTSDLVTFISRAVLLPDITYTYLCRENSLSNSWHHEKIDKYKIVQYFNAVAQLKTNEHKLKVKSYYPNRCYIAMMSDIYIICNILAKYAYIEPAFTKKELVSFMKHPSNLIEILTFKQRRIHNFILYILGKLPACMTLFFIRLFSKYKGL